MLYRALDSYEKNCFAFDTDFFSCSARHRQKTSGAFIENSFLSSKAESLFFEVEKVALFYENIDI